MKPVVVITRFNLASRYRYRKLYSDVPEGYYLFLDEEYLEKRFAIFEKYTFPSFAAQTDMDFRWIVMFHKDTPDRFKERISGYEKKLPVFEPCFLGDDESENFLDEIKKTLAAYDETGVISARVDNDDMIHRTFVERIKKDAPDQGILSFASGLQYDTRTKKCMRYSYVNNHFMSYSSKTGGDDMNIYSFQHTDVDKATDARKAVIRTKIPMWVEIVSGTNCVNEIWNRPSKVFVPYAVKQEYPALELKWSTKPQWVFSTAAALPAAFFRMFFDVISLIKLRF